MLSTILPIHHLSDDRTTEISSLSNVQSLTSSTNFLLPSHDTRGNTLLHDSLPPAVISHTFQISTSYGEHPVPSGPSLSSNGIFPITASGFQRYERNVLLYVRASFLHSLVGNVRTRPRVSGPSFEIKSLTTSFPSWVEFLCSYLSLTALFSNMTPSGWTSFAHPEGALYFWDAKRVWISRL
jgi:hypothetical protein